MRQQWSPVCFLRPTLIPRFASNCPCGVAGPPTAHNENGHPIPPNGSPPGVTNPVIPPDGKLSAPWQGNSKGGWFIELVRKVREKFRANT